ncbi:MAG: substrate-binding domain-containing protein [Chloroflexi bacterium]|nr:substrate-binding domain-containing protein [Chloroflexota bacterium]
MTTHDLRLGRRSMLSLVAAAVLALVGAAVPSVQAQPATPELILATTTSTQDSGLLDVLVPMFEQQSGYHVKTIAVGTGQALALGERGDADVLLVHAPASERAFMDGGHGVDRQLVMHNDFIVLGPANDPASVRDAMSAVDAMTRIATTGSLWISRGDNSGTHQLEKSLWRDSGIDPTGQAWYQEVGQGMGQTLTIANDKQAYTLSDRATYLARSASTDLQILAQGFPTFLNIYHVMVVNPDKSTQINEAGARAFAAFLVAPETQAVIGQFGVDRFGQPLFFPDAGKSEDELAPPAA